MVGIVMLRSLRKRRSGTDKEESVEDEKEAEPSEEKDEAETVEEETEVEPGKERDDAPETVAEHAEVAAEHALLAVEKSIENRMEANLEAE